MLLYGLSCCCWPRQMSPCCLHCRCWWWLLLAAAPPHPPTRRVVGWRSRGESLLLPLVWLLGQLLLCLIPPAAGSGPAAAAAADNTGAQRRCTWAWLASSSRVGRACAIKGDQAPDRGPSTISCGHMHPTSCLISLVHRQTLVSRSGAKDGPAGEAVQLPLHASAPAASPPLPYTLHLYMYLEALKRRKHGRSSSDGRPH